MALNFNLLVLSGFVVSKPEMRSTKNGATYCNYSLAVNWWNKKSGCDGTDFFRVQVWGDKQAQFAHTYLDKGVPILIQGTMRSNVYIPNKETKKKTFWYVLQHRMQILKKLNISELPKPKSDIELNGEEPPF